MELNPNFYRWRCTSQCRARKCCAKIIWNSKIYDASLTHPTLAIL